MCDASSDVLAPSLLFNPVPQANERAEEGADSAVHADRQPEVSRASTAMQVSGFSHPPKRLLQAPGHVDSDIAFG